MSAILTFLIALIFVFALLSLITQSICEIAIHWLDMRAKFLKSIITETLNDVQLNKNYAELLYNHPQIDLTKKDYKSIPSYISSANFSETLIDVMCREHENANTRFIKDENGNTRVINIGGLPNAYDQFKSGVNDMNYSDLKVLLSGFIKRSADLATLDKNIQAWYEELMNRATGWFKDKLQKILLAVSFVFVVAINANLFAIVDGLWTSQVLSDKIATMADAYVSNHPNAGKVTDSTVVQLVSDINTLNDTGIPIGWETLQNQSKTDSLNNAEGIKPKMWKSFKHSWAGMALGWVLMAIFVSAGAPFWFQILSKIVNLRKTGIKPKTSVKSKK